MRQCPRNFAKNTENIENTAGTELHRCLGRSCPLLSAAVVLQPLNGDKSGDKRTTAVKQRHSCDVEASRGRQSKKSRLVARLTRLAKPLARVRAVSVSVRPCPRWKQLLWALARQFRSGPKIVRIQEGFSRGLSETRRAVRRSISAEIPEEPFFCRPSHRSDDGGVLRSLASLRTTPIPGQLRRSALSPGAR
jgi:hypothetical protein